MKFVKKRQWLCVGAMVLCIVVAAVGCEKKGTSQKDTKTVIVETKKETEAAKESEMTGVIKKYTGGMMNIETEDGKELSFTVADAKIECSNGIVSGDEVKIIYTGEITGTDTSKAVVIKIVDKGEKKELKEQKISGTVQAIAMNTLTIKDNNGDVYSFMITGAETHYKNGIQAGNWVTVVYKGEIKDGNAQNVKVISITDDDENIQEEKDKTVIKDADKTVYATTTVHVRESYTTDSNSLGLLYVGNSIHETGESDNGWARVDYNGQTGFVYEQYLTTEAPQPETHQTEAPQPETSAPQPETSAPQPDEPVANPESHDGEVYEMTGVIKDATMHIITVTSDEDGQDYVFNISDAEIHLPNGLTMGQGVQVSYQGTASQDATTCTVFNVDGSVMNENEDNEFSITGTVIATSMNCMTLQTYDGAEVTFDIEDAQINCSGGLQVDAYVNVLYTNMDGTNVYYALTVNDM